MPLDTHVNPAFIPQFKPWFDESEREALNKYMLDGGYVTEFKKTREFGQMVADFTGSTYCSILSNGTVTLTAALIALGIGTGDEVIVPDYTMIATANAVLLAGAQPVFCDVEKHSMCIDFDGLKSAVTPRTKAVMLVSINGRYPKQIQSILDFCKSKGIRIVEDAAQSLGSYYKAQHVGTFGDVGSFSFSMPKIVTTGQGGALVTNSEDFFRKIELVRNFGRERAGIDKHVFFGVNFKFTDLQAVIGIEQMKKLPERMRLKKRIFKSLKDRLVDLPQVEFFETSNEVTPWFNDVLVEERDSLQSFLENKMVGSRPFYPALHTQAPYNLLPGLHPVAESLAKHGLWLPSYAQLSEAEIDRIINAVREFYGK